MDIQSWQDTSSAFATASSSQCGSSRWRTLAPRAWTPWQTTPATVYKTAVSDLGTPRQRSSRLFHTGASKPKTQLFDHKSLKMHSAKSQITHKFVTREYHKIHGQLVLCVNSRVPFAGNALWQICLLEGVLYLEDELDVAVDNDCHRYDEHADKNRDVVADYIEALVGPLDATAGQVAFQWVVRPAEQWKDWPE